MSGEHGHPELTGLAEVTGQLAARVGELEAQTAALVVTVGALAARVDALEAIPDPEPEPIYGVSVLNNGDPLGPNGVGQTVALQRMFFQSFGQVTRPYFLDNMARCADQGTVPWVSFKTPPWAEVASGGHDAAVDTVIAACDAHPGPVWLTFWHEPENDPGTATDWRAMQSRVGARVGSADVKFAPVLMSWTWDPRSGRSPADWWVDGVFDFLGVDHYSNPNPAQPQVLLGPVWDAVLASAAGWGVDVAVGEMGVLGGSGDPLREFCAGGGAVAYCYWNENQAGVADWRLSGDRLAAFKEFL